MLEIWESHISAHYHRHPLFSLWQVASLNLEDYRGTCAYCQRTLVSFAHRSRESELHPPGHWPIVCPGISLLHLLHENNAGEIWEAGLWGFQRAKQYLWILLCHCHQPLESPSSLELCSWLSVPALATLLGDFDTRPWLLPSSASVTTLLSTFNFCFPFQLWLYLSPIDSHPAGFQTPAFTKSSSKLREGTKTW